jgi:hypothetical protein
MPADLDDRRHVRIEDGRLAWMFPEIASQAGRDEIGALLRAADKLLLTIGHLLPTPTQGPVWSSAYRLTYYRLGPEPDYPVTDLFAEGWSDDLHILVRTWSDHSLAPGRRAGPPWCVSARLALTCDVDPRGCAGHVVDEWDRTGIDLPVEAVGQTLAAARWVHEVISAESVARMRLRDRQRAHPVQPPEAD